MRVALIWINAGPVQRAPVPWRNESEPHIAHRWWMVLRDASR
jgi:hypothetical protein